MAELERCQCESQGYYYVFLGCQKYGFRPFAAKIPREVFEQLRAAMAADCQALLDARGFAVSPSIGERGDYVIERAFVAR